MFALMSEDYPPHLKHLAPTDADLDSVIEEATGKPVDKGTAEKNVAALRQRIRELEVTLQQLKDRRAIGRPVGDHIKLTEHELTKARALLAGYETQLGKQN